MSLTLVTAPSAEPVTLAEAKLHLRVDLDDDDNLITEMIKTARQAAETLTNRTFIATTYDLKLDGFPGTVNSPYFDSSWHIRPPLPPLSSITSIKYINTSSGTATADTTVYDTDTGAEPGRIALAYNQTWPTAREDINAVTIRYVAGYGTTATSVPERAKSLIKLILSDLYEHREARSEIRLQDNPAVMMLAASLHVPEAA